MFISDFVLIKFTPLEDSYAAEVPEVTYAPNLLPLFKRQYANHIFTGDSFIHNQSYHTFYCCSSFPRWGAPPSRCINS